MSQPRFALIESDRFLDHDTGHHVENAGRLRAISERLAGPTADLARLPLRPATDAELLTLHTPTLIERVDATSAAGGGWLDGDTYVSAHSAEVARLAVGSCLDLAAAVWTGEFDRGMALVRPPGHHATPEQSMGFCLFSNVALVARSLRLAGVDRVFIFDWDVHHGNGTQDCLYDCPNSCFCSFHQAPFYPGTGAMEERGVGPGAGLTYNLPLPAGMGDLDYRYAFEQLVVPVVRAYDPQMILISAGYDAHREDPLGGMKLTAEGFAALAGGLARLAEETSAGGRLVGFLEGGYNPGRLAESVEATIKAWRVSGPALDPVRTEQVSTACLRQVARAKDRFGLS